MLSADRSSKAQSLRGWALLLKRRGVCSHDLAIDTTGGGRLTKDHRTLP
jgi:hypothetical protein